MYAAPALISAGLILPSYSDILNYLVSAAQTIYGTDIYLANDSQDYQYLSAIASALYDAMQLCQLAVNDESPITAIGTALDSLVKLNGLKRLTATYSTCAVTILGIAGTVIPAGVVQDAAGYLWDLTPNSIIPDGGVLSATVTCETPGAINADVGDIQNIVTPQYGWTSVSNPAAAIQGSDTETDQALRLRQSDSVSLPSQTPIQATIAAIQAVDGVARVTVYENSTDSTQDVTDIPSHSIAAVVEGGEDIDVATAIALGKTEGCGTFGSTSVELDTVNFVAGDIEFSRPTPDIIAVNITVIQLIGYTQAIEDQLIANIQNYLNTLPIGTSVQASSLYLPALMAMANLSAPSFAITSLTVNLNGGAFGASADVAWNEVAEAGAITITGGM